MTCRKYENTEYLQETWRNPLNVGQRIRMLPDEHRRPIRPKFDCVAVKS